MHNSKMRPRQSVVSSTQGMFHQNHGRNSDFTEQAFKVDDNYLNLNSGRKSARSSTIEGDRVITEPEESIQVQASQFKPIPNLVLKDPTLPRTDFCPNLSNFKDRELALPNMRIKKMHK